METYSSFANLLRSQLSRLLPTEEQVSHYRLIVEYLLGIPYYKLLNNPDTPIPCGTNERLAPILDGLARQAPIQYLLGETEFYGYPLRVTPDVLIPRPETEGLCQKILELDFSSCPQKNVIDIGTGSGAIAITLSLECPAFNVAAIDVSPKALAIAKENAQRLHAHVTFQEADLYTWQPRSAHYMLMVSNPPYIPEHEAATLAPRVRDYEPALALFVPDQDPLRPYRRLAELALQGLQLGGVCACEVHETYADPVRLLFEEEGLQNVMLYNDLQGKPRYVFASQAYPTPHENV